MTRLSVNINKIATLRNARGGNNPDVVRVAEDCQRFGAQGITVHPRPDERHIRRNDLALLKKIVTTEFNIEGYPDSRFMTLLREIKPEQATLVPDAPGVITSNQGWDTITHESVLKESISAIKDLGIRVSIFVDPIPEMAVAAAGLGADRIELYTGPYAHQFSINPERAVAPYIETASTALQHGLGINAGHDLDLNNLAYLKNALPQLDEVSIGHALICDALYFGLENTIQLYLRALK